MILNGLDVSVDVRLDNEVYQFDFESATGKTRLYNVVKSYQRSGYRAAAYSYNDLQAGVDFISVVNKVNPLLLVVDRYDMFSDMYHEELLELSKKCIVLIDSKEILPFGEYYLACSIEMTPTMIEVYE